MHRSIIGSTARVKTLTFGSFICRSCLPRDSVQLIPRARLGHSLQRVSSTNPILIHQLHRLFSSDGQHPAALEHNIKVGDSAAKRINEINLKNNTNQSFRVAVEAGGCHGFQYVMGLTSDPPQPDDIVITKDGATVYIDKMSLDLVNGSTLEFVEELIGSSFQMVGNPNAESSCGCKTSFSLQ